MKDLYAVKEELVQLAMGRMVREIHAEDSGDWRSKLWLPEEAAERCGCLGRLGRLNHLGR